MIHVGKERVILIFNTNRKDRPTTLTYTGKTPVQNVHIVLPALPELEEIAVADPAKMKFTMPAYSVVVVVVEECIINPF